MSTPPKGAFSRIPFIVFSVLLTAVSSAQDRLSVEDAVRRSLDSSPQVRAAAERVESARFGLARANVGFSPQVELAPGLGFTNGNSLLSQRIDIGGTRQAASRLAEAELEAARVQLQAARQGRAFEVASGYYDLARARAEEAAVAESARLSKELAALVRKQVEAGVVPSVQIARADIEASRVDQELLRARGAVASRLATLRSLIGDEQLKAEVVGDEVPSEFATATVDDLIAQALRNRADVARARSLVQVAQAESGVTRASRKPTLYAALASDAWSLDRDPFRGDRFGVQAFLSFPLFDRGLARAEDARDRALVRAAEADLAATERQVRMELARASEELAARQQVAANYRNDILPQSEKLLEATRRGYEQGLSALIDLIDAQRTARLTRTEYLTALYEAHRAELELRRIAATLAPAPSEKETPK